MRPTLTLRPPAQTTPARPDRCDVALRLDVNALAQTPVQQRREIPQPFFALELKRAPLEVIYSSPRHTRAPNASARSAGSIRRGSRVQT